MNTISTTEPSTITLGAIHVLSSEILFIRGEGNYSNFFLKDGRKILSCRTLKYFATLLVEEGFIRPSKSALINPSAIAHIDFKSQKSIRLVNEEVISISRRQVRPLKEYFQTLA
jgi:two-component system LytT family response regulator